MRRLTCSCLAKLTVIVGLVLPGAYADQGGVPNAASRGEVDFGEWWDEASAWAHVDPAEVEATRSLDYKLEPIKVQHRCTFAFPAGTSLDAMHEDGDCVERDLGRHGGPYELVVQRVRYVHIKSAAACGGKPGDTTGWRACARDPETGLPVMGFEFPYGSLPWQCQKFPSPTPGTGPNGCQICQRIFSCHRP